LITNVLYALILPLIEILVGVYIMRNTGNFSSVVIYQLFIYVGVVSASILNGVLLKVFIVNFLYSFGIVLSSNVLMLIMFAQSTGVVEPRIAGFALGGSAGFF